jgi:hypothetical protein
MDMSEDVRQLAADSGVCDLAGRRREAGYEVIELGFENGALRLACDSDTDEIVVVASERLDRFDEIVNDDSLADLVGKVIEQAWMMVNDRGYTDAFQLRCIDLATRSRSCCQFEVAASAITVAHVGT